MWWTSFRRLFLAFDRAREAVTPLSRSTSLCLLCLVANLAHRLQHGMDALAIDCREGRAQYTPHKGWSQHGEKGLRMGITRKKGTQFVLRYTKCLGNQASRTQQECIAHTCGRTQKGLPGASAWSVTANHPQSKSLAPVKQLASISLQLFSSEFRSCATNGGSTKLSEEVRASAGLALHTFQTWRCGCGSKLNRRGYAVFGPFFHLTGFHFGTSFLTHSHVVETCDHG